MEATQGQLKRRRLVSMGLIKWKRWKEKTIRFLVPRSELLTKVVVALVNFDRWRRPIGPRIYRTAEMRGCHFKWNTYDEVMSPSGVGKTIGAEIRIRGVAFSLVWRKP